MTNILILTIFPCLVILAAVNDLFTMTIPNWISLALLLGFAVLAPLVGISIEGALHHLLAGVLVLIAGFLLFARGLLGGGDAKLMAVCALWLGWEQTLPFMLITAIMGGVLAMIFLALRRYPLPVSLAAQDWVQRLAKQGGGIPYGIAIAAGAMIVYPDSPLMLSFVH